MPPVTTVIANSVRAGYSRETVLDGVDLTLQAGDVPLGLLGASGAGKTTLINVLRGVVKPAGGKVTYQGRAVGRLRGRDRKTFRAAVRFMSQYSMNLPEPRDTVRSRLELAAKDARKGGRTHSVSPTEMLGTVGLTEPFLDRQLRTLSGGELQRVALATALATRPDILVLDEPLTAVDPQMRGEIAGSLASLIDRLGIGVLIASHDVALLQRLCPQIAFLGNGRILARGSFDEVLGNTEHEAIRELAESAPQILQRFR